MALLDGDAEEPQSKIRRYVISTLVFLLLVALALWWIFRFYPEKKVVAQFLEAVAAEDTRRAYEIWKPNPSYSYESFLEDWGTNGYYGPVKSFRIDAARQPRGGSGVIIVVSVSPYHPFPGDEETPKHRRTKEVRLWVEISDKSISFAPDIPGR
jgi:hypothetical protein